MKLEILIKMVGLLPRDPIAAVTVKDLRPRFFADGDRGLGIKQASELTNLRRYLAEMKKQGLVRELPPVAGMERLPRFHLVEHKLYSYFMHGKVALGLLWTQHLLDPLSQALDEGDLAQMASQARLSRRERTIRDRVRIVLDGIGRAFATIQREFLRTAIDALEGGCMIRIAYQKPGGSIVERDLSVLGLAQKDGSIYLIGARSMTAAPIHYAMHRVTSMTLLHRQRADTRPGFDIDAYIESQHQLAHVLHDRPSPVELQLLVHGQALFHFKERPLPQQQPIRPSVRSGWYEVTATVPHTVMLVPFLWSHAPYVEVLGPASVRDDVAAGILTAAAFYAKPACAVERGSQEAEALV